MNGWIRVRHGGGGWISLAFEAKMLRLGRELQKRRGCHPTKCPKTKIPNRPKTDKQLTTLFVFREIHIGWIAVPVACTCLLKVSLVARHKSLS